MTEATFDPFAIMTQKVKENEESKGNNNYESTPITQPEWFGMEMGVYKSFRIIGKPFEARTEPWEAKLIMVSEILTDNGYAIPFIWPSEKDERDMDTPKVNMDFFLFRLYKAIAKGTYHKDMYNP